MTELYKADVLESPQKSQDKNRNEDSNHYIKQLQQIDNLEDKTQLNTDQGQTHNKVQ